VDLQAEAKRDAERIIATLWGGYGFPVDPVRIARDLGINVVDADLDPDVAGALVKEPGRDPVILVNASDSRNRKRFTVAHEVGHFVRRASQPEQFSYIDRRSTLSSLGADPDEIYANAFAANLLMPEDEVRRLHGDGVSDLELGLRFGVSAEAMNYRLKNLNLA
jgi:Zn-dependent peptidase ImmA (M78 family)